jgi:hypothetical protein
MRKVTGDSMAIAERVLEEALLDPELCNVINSMLDDPEVTRRQLYHTAFAQGVIHTLESINKGRIINLGTRN